MYSADFIKLNKKAQATSPPPSASPSRNSTPPSSSSRTTRPPATRTPTRPTGGGTYDATWAIIEAVKIAVADNDGKVPPDDARAKVLDAMSKVKFDGVTGPPVSFDEYGDTTNTMMTAYQVDGGKWVSKLSEAYKP